MCAGKLVCGSGQPSPGGRRTKEIGGNYRLWRKVSKTTQLSVGWNGRGSLCSPLHSRSVVVAGGRRNRQEITGCPRTRYRPTNFRRVRKSFLPVRIRARRWSRAGQEAEIMGGRGASSGSGGGSGAGGAAATAAVAVGGYTIGTAVNAGGASGSSGDHEGEAEEEEE